MVLLDIGLPGMDGYEVAKRLPEQPVLEHVVLVAITGYGQEAARQRSHAAGFDHHLVKPADLRARATGSGVCRAESDLIVFRLTVTRRKGSPTSLRAPCRCNRIAIRKG